ncbi:MAG TPA: hypothetical protein VI893_08015 [Thermoplasmata archaeon]|nr:hypothetical protein [Thermoplasmata archaeon]
MKHVMIKKEGDAAQLLSKQSDAGEPAPTGAAPQPVGTTSGDEKGLTHGKSGSLRTSKLKGESRISPELRKELLQLENPSFLKIAMDSGLNPSLFEELIAAVDDPDWRIRRSTLWIMDTIAQRSPEQIKHLVPKFLERSQERHRAVSNTAAVILLELAKYDPSWMKDIFTTFVQARITSLDAFENTDAMMMIERFHFVDKDAYKVYQPHLDAFETKQGVNPALQGRARRLKQYLLHGKVTAGIGAPPKVLKKKQGAPVKMELGTFELQLRAEQGKPMAPPPPPAPPPLPAGGYWTTLVKTEPKFPVDEIFREKK